MKVCVIGAGPSGLTTIKQLIDEGHDVVCFEKSASLGGIWFRHEGDADEMRVFDNLILTISMKLMSYSDFIHPGDREFFTREKYFEYLLAYARKFSLAERVRTRSTVTQVRRDGADEWIVTVECDGQLTEHRFDAVAICSGPFATPNRQVTGLSEFSGEVVHSSRYRNAERFRGKRVLVVGMAESGADILREISNVASECTLAIRSYTFLLPRLINGTDATDAATSRVHHYEMYVRATDARYPMQSLFGDDAVSRAVFLAAARLYGAAFGARLLAKALLGRRKADGPPADGRGRLNHLGEEMWPKKLDVGCEWTREHVALMNEWNRRSHRGESSWSQKAIFCKNVSFVPNMASGKIALRDGGIARIEGRRVFFHPSRAVPGSDGAPLGETSKEFDVIVLCTGFVRDFAALGSDVAVQDNNVRNLYKHAFHPRHGGRLAHIGYVRPYSGGIPICAEMQARYFARLCSGKLRLPDDVETRIREEKAWEDRFSTMSPRHCESIPSQVLFLDSLAKEIGCLTPMAELIANPKLFVRHWFYSFHQSSFRLTGDHARREEAMEELLRDAPSAMVPNYGALGFVALSYLPHFVHPEHALASAPPRKKAARAET